MTLDPRTKLTLVAAGSIAVLLSRAPLPLAVLLLGALAIVVAARGMRRWLGALRLLAPLLVLLTLFSAIGGTVADSVLPALKLLALGTLSTALFVTLPMDALADALLLLRVPPGVGFVIVGGLRYAPALTARWNDLIAARRARGGDIPRGPRAVPVYAAMLVPAVVRALRIADDMAEAMESRGFGARRPTMMDDYGLHSLDWLVIAVAVCALVAYVVWLR